GACRVHNTIPRGKAVKTQTLVTRLVTAYETSDEETILAALRDILSGPPSQAGDRLRPLAGPASAQLRAATPGGRWPSSSPWRRATTRRGTTWRSPPTGRSKR